MKRMMAVAMMAMAFPAVAGAAESMPLRPFDTMTGSVYVARTMCGGIPVCPQTVLLKTGDKTIAMDGALANDLSAFDGKIVTVKGYPNGNGGFEPAAFVPGKANDFITGEVVDLNDCNGKRGCNTIVAVKMGDRIITINDPVLSKQLASMIGATVSLRGTVTTITCPMGAMCIVASGNYFHWDSSTNILVKGELDKIVHIMNGESHLLRFPNGNTLPVNGKPAWADRDGSTVWISGKMGADAISKTPAFDATWASSSLPGKFHPWVLQADGSNVGRNAASQGFGSNVASSNGATGGGQAR